MFVYILMIIRILVDKIVDVHNYIKRLCILTQKCWPVKDFNFNHIKLNLESEPYNYYLFCLCLSLYLTMILDLDHDFRS